MDQTQNQNHVITIDQEIAFMTTQMKKSPKILQKNTCCIFRVPQSLVEINKEAYRPRIVSIGPYHYGNKDLEMIQEHKWRYLNDLIISTGMSLKVLLEIIVSMEVQIRESYSESIAHLTTNELAQMMVLDGCFLIEYFRKVGKLGSAHEDDPLFKMSWVSPSLMRDVLKIENQIPFFVLQKLFNETKSTDVRTLSYLILGFFNYALHRHQRVLEDNENLEGKHLLDFYRKSFINAKRRNPIEKSNDTLKLIQPATKLTIAGVKFEAIHQPDSFLDIEFKNGLLSIPQISMDDFYSSFVLNCVAFEQCYSHCSKDFTTYVVFMGCLMNTSIDVGLLSESKIIENYFGTNKDIVKFFNNVGKDVSFDLKNSYLQYLFRDINDYCKNGWHVAWAGFKHTYFASKWAGISAFAAFMLLSLAALQTFYTVFPYYHKND